MRSFVLSRARLADYPGVLREIAPLIGEESTAKLVTQYGGGNPLYIPAKFSPEHPLIELLGEQACQCLAAEFGGLSVEIPRNIALQRAQRNRLIEADWAAGMSNGKIALKHQLTTRQIRTILNKS